jgi:protein-L-isoaspartate O-methyltransferase
MNAESRYLIIASSLVVVAVTGCQAPPEARPPLKATAGMVSLQVQGAGLDYATVQFEVEVANPFKSRLRLDGLRYGLTSGANVFFSATPIPGATIPPNTTRAISFTQQIVYERFLRALNAQPGATVPFTIEAQLLLTADNRHQMQVPLSGSGSLFLPPTAQDGARTVDVIYIPTPQDVVERMLSMADVKKDDVVYDLGCGDGRIVVTAAKMYGCRAAGFDIDPRRVQESRDNARRNNVEDLVTIQQRDIFTVDLAPANVVAFYLNPIVNRRLIPQLRALRPGSRIVSHSFPVGDVKPDRVVTMTSTEDGQEHHIYLWVAPLKLD